MAMTYDEKGDGGLVQFGGYVNAAYAPELKWPIVYDYYNRLRRSDPEIVVIREAMSTVAGAQKISTELPENASADDQRYAEFQDSVLSDVEGGISKWLGEAVSYSPFMGWATWEIVPGKRMSGWRPPGDDDWRSEYDDGLIGVRRLGFRDHSSFQRWEFGDNGRVLGMWQCNPPQPLTMLPSESLVHLRYGDANNPEGLSPLEAVYRLERIKYGLEVVQGIGYEHSAGYLDVVKETTGPLTSTDKTNIREAARAILTAQEGNYAAWPFGFKGEIKDIPFGSAGAILEAIKFYATLKFAVFNMSFLAMSTLSGTGSYSARSDASQMWLQSLNGTLDNFTAQLDNSLGKKLWEWNKASFPGVTRRPRLKITHAEKSYELAELASFAQSLNALSPLGADDLLAIRKRSGFLPEVLPTDQTQTNTTAPAMNDAPTPDAQQLAAAWGKAKTPRIIELSGGKTSVMLAELARDFATIKADYGDKIYTAILEYLASAGRVTSYKNTVKRLAVSTLPEVFYLGYAAGGGEQVDREDDQWLTARVNEEVAHIDTLFASMRDLRGETDTIDKSTFKDEANARADGYLRTLAGVYAQGLLRGRKNIMLTMVGEDGQESCRDCQRNKGKRFSARKWLRMGIPGTPGNGWECGGWNCNHGLIDDDGNSWLPEAL